MKKYAVTMQSTPGFYAQYGPGDVEVWAENEEQALDRAFNELRRTAFPDRASRSFWKVLDIRVIDVAK